MKFQHFFSVLKFRFAPRFYKMTHSGNAVRSAEMSRQATEFYKMG